MIDVLSIYRWPSQAFWRYFEVQALREIPCERPILEIGCGDGRFSSLVFEAIDDAIDINPRMVKKCQERSGRFYRRIRCLDARALECQEGEVATVYANCVLEHIPEIEGVLASCLHSLRPGGKLVITVPLVRMNQHLLLPWRWYTQLRQRQLAHLNLLSEESWEKLLTAVGFTNVEIRPYLSGRACKFWDTIDSIGCIGFGRCRLATAAGLFAGRVLPALIRRWIAGHLAFWLSAKVAAETNREPACAAAIIAQKPRPEISQ